MTNEVVEAAAPAAACITDKLAAGFKSQVAEGRELWDGVLAWLAEKGVEYAMNIVAALLIFLVGWLVIRLVDRGIRKALARGGRKKLLVNFIVSVVTKSCWALLLVTVLGRLGVNVGPLVAGLGVTGFILGFAFQESLGNLASGLMIAINEPFKVGDFIEAAGHMGSVIEVNMMATVMATGDNKRIVIPNKSAWGGPIVNYSAMATRRVDLQVGIAYGSDIGRALDVIREAVLAVPGVLAEPAPTVATAALADSQITVNVRPWVRNADYWKVYAATLKSVKEELARAGIEIPFPQVVVHKAD
ncbi:MAG: mechanosensitive ion channel family protein [Kiritimatiellae bacterium]|nr:mechanosensitive ion channel family protein [Kiritimatiellia bacterium]